jgi:uncharacterized membrane protein
MSRPPEHPGSPSDPWGGNSDPGGHPPPHPGYGPPPGSHPGYPPPPPGYGGPPPPLPYGTPPPGQPPPGEQFDIADAFSWAWHKFSKNATALIVATVAYLVVLGVIGAILFGHLSSHAGGFGGLGLTGIGVFYLVMIPSGIFMQAAFLSGCLDIADGKPATIGSFFHPHNFGRVALSALLVIALTSIGNILCGFPGLIFSFFALFTIAFATDRALPPVEALNASIATVKSNTRVALLSWLVQVLVLAIGALLCGVGMLVAFPVATLIQTYTCRRLSGGPIAPVSQ